MKNATALVIATVAEKGAGKGLFFELVTKLLPNKRVAMIRSSDPWREILGVLCKDESRDNISLLATAIRNAFRDDGILVPVMQRRLKTTDADIIIIDGFRKPEELSLIRQLGGVVVYIAASPEIRFQRRSANAETTDEEGMSWEQFMRQEQAATETSIRNMGETMANLQIENNGTPKQFEEKIHAFLDTHVIPRV